MRWPSGAKICAPSPVLDQTLPLLSQRMPSGPPLSILVKTLPPVREVPSAETLKTRMWRGVPESAM